MYMSHSWIALITAIIFGVLGTISMKMSDGLQRLKPCLALIVFYMISFAALTVALQGIDISIVYAIWSGVGTIFVAIAGVLLFQESISAKKVISLLLVVIGVIGIHLTNVIA
jgi:small multidrug resistance pump